MDTNICCPSCTVRIRPRMQIVQFCAPVLTSDRRHHGLRKGVTCVAEPVEVQPLGDLELICLLADQIAREWGLAVAVFSAFGGSRCSATPRMTKAMPARSRAVGTWARTIRPITVAVAGSRASMRGKGARGT